jgi:hypothetical protein
MHTTDIINQIDTIAAEINVLPTQYAETTENRNRLQIALNDLQHAVIMLENLRG